MYVCVKMMSKGLKEALTVLIVTHITQVKRVKSDVCGFYATLYTEYFLLILLLILKGSKESNTMYCTLYIGPLTPPRGKAIYLKAFHLVGLAVHHQSD